MTDPSPSVVDLAITRARDGRLSMQSVLWSFAASTVYVPSGADPGPDRAGLRPVYYSKDGSQMLAVFTSPSGATTIGDLAQYLVTFGGAELLRTMPAADGLVVNPGSQLGFDIEPQGLAAFRQELSV